MWDFILNDLVYICQAIYHDRLHQPKVYDYILIFRFKQADAYNLFLFLIFHGRHDLI